jgi:type IV secretory pathway TraG/TraD family ATPase VirD4
MKGPNYLRKMLKGSPCRTADEEFAAIKLNSSENFLFGVTSGLMQKLTPWLTQQIVTLTCKTDIDPDQLRNELFTFYLSVPARRRDLKALISLIFNYLLNLALETKFTYPLTLMLDEFTNFGQIPGFTDTLTVIRKTGIGAVLGFQDYMQLQKVYGNTDAAIIFSQPGTRVFFRPRAFNTAKEISTALGPTTIEHIRITDTGRTDTREIGRPLMTPGELMSLEDHEVIIFTPSTPPLRHQKFTPQSFAWATQAPLPNRFPHPLDTDAMQCGKEIPAQEFPQQKKQKQDRDFDRNKWKENRGNRPDKQKPQQNKYKQQKPRSDWDDRPKPDDQEHGFKKSKDRGRDVPDSDL